jgi:hypothetical protein
MENLKIASIECYTFIRFLFMAYAPLMLGFIQSAPAWCIVSGKDEISRICAVTLRVWQAVFISNI